LVHFAARAGWCIETHSVFLTSPVLTPRQTKCRPSELGPFAPHFVDLLRQLPNVKVVVTFGSVPRDFWRRQIWGDAELQKQARAAVGEGGLTGNTYLPTGSTPSQCSSMVYRTLTPICTKHCGTHILMPPPPPPSPTPPSHSLPSPHPLSK
jgi:hypothetical protein